MCLELWFPRINTLFFYKYWPLLSAIVTCWSCTASRSYSVLVLGRCHQKGGAVFEPCSKSWMCLCQKTRVGSAWLCSAGTWHAFPLVFPYGNGRFPIQWQVIVSRWGVSSFPVGRMDQVALQACAAWMSAKLFPLPLVTEIRPQHILFNSTETQIKCFLH